MRKRKLTHLVVLAIIVIAVLVATLIPAKVSLTSSGFLSLQLSTAQANPGWVSPTGFNDPSSDWIDEIKAYDGNTALYAESGPMPAFGNSGWLELTHATLSCSKIRFWATASPDIYSLVTITVQVYYSGGWHGIYSGSWAKDQWVEVEVGSTESITAMRVIGGGGAEDDDVLRLHEAEFWVECAENIENTPSSKDFGVVAESSTTSTGLTFFTVTNNSGGSVDISIQGTDMTGGTTWTLSDTATPGTNICGLKAGLEGGSYTVIVKKNSPYNDLKTNLADSGTQKWGLQLLAPSTTTDGVEKSGTVTITASCV